MVAPEMVRITAGRPAEDRDVKRNERRMKMLEVRT
jgi:hypothetical protein